MTTAEMKWDDSTPEEVLRIFEKRHVTNTFRNGDLVGPALSKLTKELAAAIRQSLDPYFMFSLPEPAHDLLDNLQATGLFGRSLDDVVERLAMKQLEALVEDNSRLLQDPDKWGES